VASDALTPETARDLLYPLLDDSKSVSLDDILAAWERDRARLAEVTAQRDALGPLAEGLLNDENQYCFTDEQALAARAALTAIAAERGKGEG
jgi:hypothetical protein